MGILGFGRKGGGGDGGGGDDAEKPRGLLDRLRAGLSKTAQVLRTDVRDLFKREGRLVDDAFLDELRAVLVRTDMGPAAAEAIVEDVRARSRARVVEPEAVLDSIRTQLLARLRDTAAPIAAAASGPTVILVTGVNGSGKTTSIAKLARRYTRDGRRVVLGAGDTFRAAAVEQLGIWAGRTGAHLIAQAAGADPAAVAFDAVQAARSRGADLLIADTAGRLQAQAQLMDELRKVRRVIGKADPAAPHEVLLVLDATQGQNALAQAQQFHAAVGVTGLVLTKLDGTARGGIVLAIARQMKLPIRFVGVGEQGADLAEFDAAAFARALVDGPAG